MDMISPRLIDELVSCLAAVVDKIVVGSEDVVRESVVAHKLLDVFDRVELGGFGRQSENGDGGGNDPLADRCRPA